MGVMFDLASSPECLKELECELPKSSALDRKRWASRILQEHIDLKELSHLLFQKKEIALRFLWLLSEIGEQDPKALLHHLPYLFKLREQGEHVDLHAQFATYWLIAGVPNENEAAAINLLFGLLNSSVANVTTKSRALLVLQALTSKFPELKNELKVCLEEQLNRNTKNFNKQAMKMLEALDG